MYQNNGENQIKEIINAAKFSIFFVDDHQIVTTSDIGSSKEIKKWCKYYNAIVYEDKLTSQFRCNGSDAYLSWVDNVLEIEDTANDELDIDYDVRIFDDPLALKKAIFEKNKIANKSRMLAGYCWKWQKMVEIDQMFTILKLETFRCHGILHQLKLGQLMRNL